MAVGHTYNRCAEVVTSRYMFTQRRSSGLAFQQLIYCRRLRDDVKSGAISRCTLSTQVTVSSF